MNFDLQTFVTKYGAAAAVAQGTDSVLFGKSFKLDPVAIVTDMICFYVSDNFAGPAVQGLLTTASPNMPKLQRQQLSRIIADVGLFWVKASMGITPQRPLTQLAVRSIAADVVSNTLL